MSVTLEVCKLKVILRFYIFIYKTLNDLKCLYGHLASVIPIIPSPVHDSVIRLGNIVNAQSKLKKRQLALIQLLLTLN